jgi:hypothetical protein
MKTIILLTLLSLNLMAEENWYMLWTAENKCGAPVFNGVDVSPRKMMERYPKCSIDTSGNGIYLMDCTKEKTLNTTFVYTKDLDSCLQAKNILAGVAKKIKARCCR